MTIDLEVFTLDSIGVEELSSVKKVCIIQTAFLGDVILATGLIDSIANEFPEAVIHFVVRKGNEKVLENNPSLTGIHIWNKSANKQKNLIKLAYALRKEKFDVIINLQRFASSGILGVFAAPSLLIGFSQNPFSFLFHKRVLHTTNGSHETERNFNLANSVFPSLQYFKPKIYPSIEDFDIAYGYTAGLPYICIAPGSVWNTKQFSNNQWLLLAKSIPENLEIIWLGGPAEVELCQSLSNRSKGKVLAGQTTYLQSAALIKNAQITYTNDSGSLHLASAVNGNVAAVYCSTIPSFGFGPLSPISFIIEEKVGLPCRPCGLHGYKKCPQGHFLCSKGITKDQILEPLLRAISKK